MGASKKYPEEYSYAHRLITKKARQLLGKYGFHQPDREDLEQELWLDLLKRWPKYSSARSSIKTFINRVVDHKIASIIEYRQAQMRDCRADMQSIDVLQGNEDGDILDWEKVIDRRDYFRLFENPFRSALERQNMTIDIENSVAELPSELRWLCGELKAKFISEISRETGIPRSTLYDLIKQIRSALKNSGLKKYL